MKQTVELCLRNRNKIAAIVPYRKTDGETGTVVHFTNGTHACFPADAANGWPNTWQATTPPP